MSYRDGVATLIINDVTQKDAARYTCEAVNKHGHASTTSHLKVRGTSQYILSRTIQVLLLCYAGRCHYLLNGDMLEHSLSSESSGGNNT